jgi:hypothetical protein
MSHHREQRDYRGQEQRKQQRIYEPFPAKIAGKGPGGDSFEAETLLDDLSAGGLYTRLDRHIDTGAKLSFEIRLARAESHENVGQRVAAEGVVLRSEPQPDGRCGIAVRFTRYKCL